MELHSAHDIISSLSLIPSNSPILNEILNQISALSKDEQQQWSLFQFLHCLELEKSSHPSSIHQLVILITVCYNFRLNIDGKEVKELLKRMFVKEGGKYKKILLERKWIQETEVLQYKEGVFQRMMNGIREWFS